MNTSLIAKMITCLLTLTCLPDLAYSANTGCMLKPISTVDIRSPIVGRLSNIYVDRGSYVKKGQLLAKLDSSVEQAAAKSARYRSQTHAQITAAQNRVLAAQQKADRMKILYDADFMSSQALDDANNELKVAQSELDAAIESKTLAKYEYESTLSELNRKTLVSPISGVVTVRYLDTGSIVSPTDGDKPILTVARTNRLKVQMIVPVAFFKNYSIGSKITIIPESPFDTPIRTTVSIKDSAIDAASGTFSMIAYIDNPNNKIPSGVLCTFR